MVLLMQVLAVLCAALVLGALWRRGSGTPAYAVAAVIAAAATLLFWSNGWATAERYDKTRQEAPTDDRFGASTAGGRNLSVNVDFLVWAADRMPRDATFSVIPPLPTSYYQWTTYQLFPRRFTSVEQADYLLFYGADPSGTDYDRARYPSTARYGPGHHIARSADAG